MKIITARSPEAIRYISPHIIPDGDYSKEDFEALLRNILVNNPDKIFLPLAFDGDNLVAFLVALAEESKGHVWILQAWTDPKLEDKRVKNTLFIKLILWTLAKGRRSIRGVTQRKTGPFLRAWKFKPFSSILEYSIEEDFEERLLDITSNGEDSAVAEPTVQPPEPKLRAKISPQADLPDPSKEDTRDVPN